MASSHSRNQQPEQENPSRRTIARESSQERTFAYGRGPEAQRRHYLTQLRDSYGNATAGFARETAQEGREAARQGLLCGASPRRAGGSAVRGGAGVRGGTASLRRPRAVGSWSDKQLPWRPRLVVMGNGGCLEQQREHWSQVGGGDWPPPQFEKLVREGNVQLRAWCAAAQLSARRQQQQQQQLSGAAASLAAEVPYSLPAPLFLDRAASMESVPRLSGSPCFHHHPYGLLSDTHVQFVLNALCHR